MNVEYKIGSIESESDWKTVAEVLGGPSNVVNNIIRYLILLQTKSYLVESRYIDRDYSSDYRRFYSQTFKTYDRHCTRVHFFSEPIGPILGASQWQQRVDLLQRTSKRSYKGFCVVRPLQGASIGRTILDAVGPTQANLESVVTCRAEFRANILGAELRVSGTSFMQQDSRVGACAQVAIWTGVRHMHERYKYNWLSVADITRLASPNTPEEAASLPAGSDFLTSERMIRAINEMGYQPLCFQGPTIGADILPYVESGLPVILGLQTDDGSLGHAVTVIGRVFSQLRTPSNNPYAYIPAYIVHDDQLGPYMLVPTNSSAAGTHKLDTNQLVRHKIRGTEVQFDVSEHAVFAVALMPVRAFSTAKEAEKTALRRIEDAFNKVDKFKADLSKKVPDLDHRLLDEVVAANKANKIVLRTYLTSASGYRRHIALGTACDDLKDVLLRLHLPHYSWVTEVSTEDSYNQSSAGLRLIYGHSVLDATSTGKDTTGVLALHLPGMVILRNVDARPSEKSEVGEVIQNDKKYECREKRFGH